MGLVGDKIDILGQYAVFGGDIGQPPAGIAQTIGGNTAQGGGPVVDNLEKALKGALEAISKEANLE